MQLDKPHIPQPRPNLPPMEPWVAWAIVILIPVDVLCIGYILHLVCN